MKLLKKLMVTAAALALVVSVTACGNQDQASNGDSGDGASGEGVLKAIQDKGEVVIGTSAEFAPFEFHHIENGEDKIVGADVKLAEEIGKELGVKVKFEDMDFDGLIPALQAGKVDMVIAGLSPTDERREAVDFSDVYYTGKNALVVRKGDADKFKSIDELKDLKIGAQKGSIQENYAMNTIKADKITSLAQTPELMMELKNKNIDAVVTNDAVGQVNIAQTEGIEFANLDLGENVDEAMAVGFKKGDNKSLIDAVNKVIKESKDSGKLDQFIKEAAELASKK